MKELYPVGIDARDADDRGGEAESGGFWERNRSRFLALAAVAVVALSVLALSRMLGDVDYDDLVVAIQNTTWLDIGLALLFTALSFAALSIYDRQALALAAHKVPFSYVALTSFCAYAVGNIAGFGPLTGGTVRYRFYAPLGVSPEDVARIVGYVTAAFGFGLLFVTGLGLLTADAKLAALVGLPAIAVRVTAIAILAFVGAVFIAATVGPRQVTVFGRSGRYSRSGSAGSATRRDGGGSDCFGACPVGPAACRCDRLPVDAVDLFRGDRARHTEPRTWRRRRLRDGYPRRARHHAAARRAGRRAAALSRHLLRDAAGRGGDRTHGHGAQARSSGECGARPRDGRAGAARSVGLCRDARSDARLLGRDTRLRPEAGLAAIRISASGRRGGSLHRQHSRPAHDPDRPRTRASAGRRVVADSRACGELDRARLRQGL